MNLFVLLFYITTFFFPLPLTPVCYILILCSMWEMYQQNKKAGSYTTSISRQRVMRLTRMVFALSVFVMSTAPFHGIQLMNLLSSQPTLTFYMSYYICLSYTSNRVNPFLYILLPEGSLAVHKCGRQDGRTEFQHH
ncbi:LOW QUALITY PROTEIN: melanin-concentrating hormone receptor 2 [Cyanocitta cristata]